MERLGRDGPFFQDGLVLAILAVIIPATSSGWRRGRVSQEAGSRWNWAGNVL